MSQDDRREARDTDETLELGTAAGPTPTLPLGDAVFGPPAGAPGPTTPEPPGGVPGADRPTGPAHDGPPTGATTGGAGAPSPAPVPSRGPRVGTIVWGFLIVAFGAAVLATALGARVDVGLAAIVVLAVAGVTLVVGSVAVGARRRGRG
jgi:hypothetical protein